MLAKLMFFFISAKFFTKKNDKYAFLIYKRNCTLCFITEFGSHT